MLATPRARFGDRLREPTEHVPTVHRGIHLLRAGQTARQKTATRSTTETEHTARKLLPTEAASTRTVMATRPARPAALQASAKQSHLRRETCATDTAPRQKLPRSPQHAAPMPRGRTHGRRHAMCAVASRLWQPRVRQATERVTALPHRQDRERRSADERGYGPHNLPRSRPQDDRRH